MPLIAFAVLLSGILFVMRTLHVFRERGLIREPIVTKIGIGLLAMMSFAQFLVFARPFVATLLIVALMFVPLAILATIEFKSVDGYRSRIPIFVDRWILNLRLGNSMRAARDAALRDESEGFQSLLRPIFETRGGERSQHLLLPPNIRKEFEQISLASHAGLERLENLRRVLRKSSEFRRKSGQAARQTAIQSIVMLLLVFAMSFYTIQRYGWTQSGDFVTVSVFLSLIGVIVMVRLARKTKWKF